MKNDPVNHPKHYCTHPSGVECIVISETMSFTLGNAFKYLFRCGSKGYPVQDLNKARWYLERELARRESLPRWCRLFAENDHIDARHDGSEEFQWLLSFEHRYSGHMRPALERVYVAAVLSRSVRPLRAALASVERMIKLQEWCESETAQQGGAK